MGIGSDNATPRTCNINNWKFFQDFLYDNMLAFDKPSAIKPATSVSSFEVGIELEPGLGTSAVLAALH